MPVDAVTHQDGWAKAWADSRLRTAAPKIDPIQLWGGDAIVHPEYQPFPLSGLYKRREGQRYGRPDRAIRLPGQDAVAEAMLLTQPRVARCPVFG